VFNITKAYTIQPIDHISSTENNVQNIPELPHMNSLTWRCYSRNYYGFCNVQQCQDPF